MVPKIGAPGVDGMCMRNFRTKRRMSSCSHESLIRIEIAGMSREVCESCGRVAIGYVENHARAKVAQLAAAASSGSSGSIATA
jgi:hypothetical protein